MLDGEPAKAMAFIIVLIGFIAIGVRLVGWKSLFIILLLLVGFKIASSL